MKKSFKFLLLLFLFILIINVLLQPMSSNDKSTLLVEIKPGTAGRQIGSLLQQKGIIKSKYTFNILLSLRGLDNSLKAGVYELSPSYNLNKVIDVLQEGRVATFKVTIPEGFTIEEIANRLSAITGYDSESFLSVARNGFDRAYIKKNSSSRFRLEGFIYPDTYIIPREYTPREIMAVMINEFEERWLENLEEKYRKGKEYTPYELVTIASLIEKEARLDEEKPLIAGVIYNRLKRNMLLQLDASVQYSLPAYKDRVLYSDLKLDSPYNTYLYPALPPGPISSPGDKSIQAALNPEDSDYLFYFARDDGSHVFSHNYQDHLKKQQQEKMRDKK